MEHGHARENRHVHFGIACVEYAATSIEIGAADEVGGLAGGIESGVVAGVLIPKRQRAESMVMAPEVPILQQANVLGKRAEVTIVGLSGNESGDQVRNLQAQARVVRHSQG